MRKITVLLVDDHPIFRQGVADTLSLNPELMIVGQASDGDEGWQLIEALQPEVVILDINMPGLNGVQIMKKIRLAKLASRVIFLTAYDDLEQKIHAMNLGAAAYCSKDILPEKLDWTIQQVSLGDYVYEDQVIPDAEFGKFVETITTQKFQSSLWGADSNPALSAREMEVLLCLAQGLSNKEIARDLKISQQTVKNHITSILKKLEVADRTQAVLYALRRGWVHFSKDQQHNID